MDIRVLSRYLSRLLSCTRLSKQSPCRPNTWHTCVIIQMYVLICHKNLRAHTHARTHTHIFLFYNNIYIFFYQIGLYIIILYHEQNLWCLERLSLSLFLSVAVVKVRVWENLSHKSHCVLYDYRNPRVVSMAVCHLCGDSVFVCVVPTVQFSWDPT